MKFRNRVRTHRGRHTRSLPLLGSARVRPKSIAVLATIGLVLVLSQLGLGSDNSDPSPTTTAPPPQSDTLPSDAEPPAGDNDPVINAPDPEEEGSTFYVSTDGSDASDGSVGTPWATIGHGVTQLDEGDTLLVRQGIYRESIRTGPLNHGSQTRPITLAAHPGETPVIRGLVWLVDPSYWEIEGLTIEWDPEIGGPQDHMMKITGGTGWVLRDNELRGAQSYAALLIAGGETADETPTFWRVVGNCIHDTVSTNDTNQDHLIYVNSGVEPSHGIIERNVMWGALNGSGIKLGGPTPTVGGAVDVTVRFNTIASTAQSLSVSWQASNNIIIGNVLADVPEGRTHVRAFQLSGTNNWAYSNIFDRTPLVWSDDGFGTVEVDESNRAADLEFINEGRCDGWLPMRPLAGVGHTGAGPSPTTPR